MLGSRITTLLIKMPFVLAACAMVLACSHQSKVAPSQGHIGGHGDIAAQTAVAEPNKVKAPIPMPVRSNPVLPPPKPIKKAQTYSVVVNEVPVKEILFALARESKINVDIHPSIQGRATLNAVDQTLPAILERLSRQVDLTYKMAGNVLVITPDQPVLRTYKVDYVNMNRDTKGFIGADGQISSATQTTGSSGTVNSSAGNGANNSSRTSVESVSSNHLWESLIQNIKQLLAETDKEVIVSRFGTSGENTPADTEQAKSENEAKNEQREEQRSEYKTLFAANVIANPETGVISVRATNRQHEKVQEFIDLVMGSAKKQVLIEATIVEVSLNDGYQAGIDWSRLGTAAGGNGFTFSQRLNANGFTPGNITSRATGDGLVAGYFNPVSSLGNIAGSVKLLKQFGNTKVLSSPKLMVLNNQTAVLKVVDNLVYFTVQATQGFSTGGGVTTSPTITTTPNTVPVGLVMSVTPQISQSNAVNVNVRPTISRVVGQGVLDPNPLLNIESRIPQIQVREMESMLRVDSGSIAVLGGLMQDDIQTATDSVPGLADVPGVGNAFKGRTDSNKKTELVIFLRPTVIKSASLESDELKSYKKYLPAQQLQKALDEAN